MRITFTPFILFQKIKDPFSLFPLILFSNCSHTEALEQLALKNTHPLHWKQHFSVLLHGTPRAEDDGAGVKDITEEFYAFMHGTQRTHTVLRVFSFFMLNVPFPGLFFSSEFLLVVLFVFAFIMGVGNYLHEDYHLRPPDGVPDCPLHPPQLARQEVAQAQPRHHPGACPVPQRGQ